MAASYNTNNFQNDGSVQSFAGTAPNPGIGGDPSSNRLAQAGLVPGAGGVLSDLAGKVFNINFNGADGQRVAAEIDWRVRISMASTAAALFYNNAANPIMAPLRNTKGLVFPYTPTVSMTHTAKYGQTPLTHSNYSSYFYEGSEVSTINIKGDFTVQNATDGQYLMAAIQFLRSCTKMFYGNEIFAGSPPPMVFLDGYGPTVIPHVPCVVTQFNQSLPSDVDYVQIPVGVPVNGVQAGNPLATANYGATVRLPTHCSLDVTLQPVYSRLNISRNFSLERFASGGLIQNGSSSTGGFI